MNDKEQKELSQNLRELDQNELKHFLDYVNEGNIIHAGSPEMEFCDKMLQRAMVILGSLNTGFCAPNKVSMIMNELTNGGFDPTASVVLPFSTDFGCNIHVEKGVFINAGVSMQDQGGIYIGEGTLIGHRVVLATLNHVMEPEHRHDLIAKPIHIGKNVWIGSNATILPGVTIGDNAVVAAGAVVREDVPENTVVGGVPARVLKKI